MTERYSVRVPLPGFWRRDFFWFVEGAGFEKPVQNLQAKKRLHGNHVAWDRSKCSAWDQSKR
ncbi:hypothetical protein AYM40_17850 [Paraburkholderia phytofirmans OLGA172]|uniref:Uncharacterized protein n=1 Tax=Paraburkholderia phytofirmans OLGA172 TaxID=1417228 RepID=A0A160FNF0_9BURK|nr:hypothetical protein AYM40_17850 [Paraburkholderia phytofirmans OLGA172]